MSSKRTEHWMVNQQLEGRLCRGIRKSHLFHPSPNDFRLASRARSLVGVSSALIIGKAFAEDEDNGAVGEKDTF
jgi:hypothetical protein